MGRHARRAGPFATVVVGLVILAGCGGSDGGTGGVGITSGRIGGYAFTVVDGTVTQSSDNGPISATAEAAIVFDDSITTLGGGTEVAVALTADISDGGSAGAAAYGSMADQFAEALAGGVIRTGSDYSYGLFWGLEDTPPTSNTFSPVASSTIEVIVSFDNSYNPAYISMWHPDWTGLAPFDTCDAVVETDTGIAGGGLVDQGNGDRIAVIFENATISDAIIDVSVSTACF